MSIEILHTDSDTELFNDWLAQSVQESEVPLTMDDPETVGRVAVLLTLSSPETAADRSERAAA